MYPGKQYTHKFKAKFEWKVGNRSSQASFVHKYLWADTLITHSDFSLEKNKSENRIFKKGTIKKIRTSFFSLPRENKVKEVLSGQATKSGKPKLIWQISCGS